MRFLPRMLCLLWLLFLGLAIWGKASQSTQPPIYDAIDYWCKGQAFWQAVSKGQPFNPLNVDPSLRPPGTVLMSYPFGFTKDFRPYYFRSVYFPVILMVLAVYVAAWPVGEWTTLLAALFLSTVPGFYHFEFPTEMGYWGLVDCFFAGMAALAMACGLHSVRRDRLRMLLLAALLAAFCLLIKPAGLVVMGLFAAAWLMLSLGRPRRYLLGGGAILAAVYGLTCAACFSSAYLSHFQIEWEGRVLTNMHQMKVGLPGESWRDIPPLFWRRIHFSLGDGPALALLLSFLLAPWFLRPLRQVAAGLMVLTLGSMFCFHVDGMREFRYVLPFALMAAALCLPAALTALQRLPRPLRVGVAAVCMLPPLGLALALAHPAPSAQLQEALGVQVEVGRTRDEEEAIRKLVHEAAMRDYIPRLYSLHPFLVADGPFGSAPLVSEEGGKIPFVVFRANHPFRPYVINLQDVMTADYILFPTADDHYFRDNLLHLTNVETYTQELRLFAAWLTLCDDRQGLTLLATMPGARLVRVSQVELFEKSLQDFVGRYKWRPLFYQENPSHWVTEADVLHLPTGVLDPQDIYFGNAIRMRAVAVEAQPNMLVVKLFWQHLLPSDEKRFLYVAARALGNKVVGQATIDLSGAHPPDAAHTVRYDIAYVPIPSGVTVPDLVLVGYYGRNTTYLVPNKGRVEWHCRLHMTLKPEIKS